jgi:hypothetical protein
MLSEEKKSSKLLPSEMQILIVTLGKAMQESSLVPTLCQKPRILQWVVQHSTCHCQSWRKGLQDYSFPT